MFTSGENYRTVYKRSLQKTQEIGFNRGSVDNKREDTRFTTTPKKGTVPEVRRQKGRNCKRQTLKSQRHRN